LTPYRDRVDAYNIQVLNSLPGETVCFQAQDILNGVRPIPCSQEHTFDTLQPLLLLKKGAQVVVTQNLSSSIKNGTLGVIDSITPDSVSLLYYRRSGGPRKVTIHRKIEYLHLGTSTISRHQFPLALAFGLTIHKCQGLTLRKVIIDMSLSFFQTGMAYVAFSRAPSLENITILGWDPNSFFVDEVSKLRYMD